MTEPATFHHAPVWRTALVRAGGRRPAMADIPAQEWDLLFRAALDALERLAIEQAPRASGAAPGLLLPPALAMRECLDALDQLRRSVPGARPLRSPWP